MFARLDFLATATGSGAAKYPLLLTAFERQTGQFSCVSDSVLFVKDWTHAHGVRVLERWVHSLKRLELVPVLSSLLISRVSCFRVGFCG